MLSGGRELEVWGDPIDHSLSPRLHAAAYRELGLDWSYGRRRVSEASFSGEFAALGGTLRGLSLTMPLKALAFEAAVTRNRHGELSGAVNTLLLTEGGPHGFNTDVAGIAADIADQGVPHAERARIVGSGATATSALLALEILGVDEVEVAARRPEAAQALVELGRRLGVRVHTVGLDGHDGRPVALTIATLPGGVDLSPSVADALAADGGLLYDVVYGHWPTALAQAWQCRGARAVPGIGMLVQQALRQVRVFLTGSDEEPLPAEATVLASMHAAVTEA
ncbi:shikimate dehydrogenase [Microbacterium protaetiae]|uniref:Shikimate dehydrogenase n=2 Tax=Microbacterium protaetiae TaxID=2509458 RepID=A0A4P6EKT9_9MICO|nr:shikimate dehydrogenase [Microbacterium protaetiae]QAY61909.1 shikimate dehydrogenase [Microbacterium protaetiae]